MIDLKKGQGINLTKASGSLSKVVMGLGWQGVDGKTLDLDSYVALQDANGNNLDFIYWGKLSGSGIEHHGDDLVGGGTGVNETIDININSLPSNVTKIVCGLFIYSGASNLAQVDHAFVKISDQSGTDIVNFNVKDQFGSNKSLIVGNLVKKNDGEWVFDAVGEGSNMSYSDIKRTYTTDTVSSEGEPRRGLMGRLFGR